MSGQMRIGGDCKHGYPSGHQCPECEVASELRFMNQPITATGIELEVCEDIAARQKLGLNKYGVTVADNPQALKAWLVEHYQELIDAAIYVKRAIREIERVEKEPKRSELPSSTDSALPCPFCGGNPILISKNLHDTIPEPRRKLYWYVCNTSGCGVSVQYGEWTEASALRTWNIRHARALT